MIHPKLFEFTTKIYNDVLAVNIPWGVLIEPASINIDYYNKETMKSLVEKAEELNKDFYLLDEDIKAINDAFLNLLFGLDTQLLSRKKENINQSILETDFKECFEKVNDILKDKKLTYKLIHYFLTQFILFINRNKHTQKKYSWHIRCNADEFKLTLETIFCPILDQVILEICLC